LDIAIKKLSDMDQELKNQYSLTSGLDSGTVMESRDLVSVSRPVSWGLGLEGIRSRSRRI